MPARDQASRQRRPPFGTQLPNDRLLPDRGGLDATPDTVGGMTVATAQTSDLMAQATGSSWAVEPDTSLGTPGPEAWTGSQQAVTALNVTVAAVSVVRTTASLTQVLFLQEAGDPALISVNDIHQGQIGDCFLLSSIGELALWYPSAITNMIRVNADGTETVTLYVAASGALPTFGTTSFKAVSVTVDNIFPSNAVNNGASQDVLNGQKEIWVQVLEKAVATLNGGYNAIANGGYPVISMEELTGQAATWISTNSLTLQLLQSYMAAGDLIVMDTPSSGSLAYNLVNSHAYMFESLTMVSGTPMVQLGNPWGSYQPSAIPLSQLPWVIVGSGYRTVRRQQQHQRHGGQRHHHSPDRRHQCPHRSRRRQRHADLRQRDQRRDRRQYRDPDRRHRCRHDHPGRRRGQRLDRPGCRQRHPDLRQFRQLRDRRQHRDHHRRLRQRHSHLRHRADHRHLVDLGAGANKLTLANTANTGTVKNVTTLIGGSGADAITLGTALVNGSIDLGAGNDTLTLANGTNSASVANTETVTGGSGNDSITLGAAVANASIDLGAGNDALTLGAFANTATVANTETITGGAGADIVTLGTALAASMQVDLGGGANRLSLADTANTGTVKNATTLIGGSGADTITLGAAAANASIDLGGGNDILTFGNFANSATVANTETVTGGSGADTVTLGTALTAAMPVDLGAGADKLTLANTANTGTVKNVTTLIGGTGADTITLGTALATAALTSARATTRCTGGEFTNRVSVANTETVLGGTGNDTIVLTGSNASLVIGGEGNNFITGNAGADRFVLDQNDSGNITAIKNFNPPGDQIALDTIGSAILSGNTYNLGGAAITLGTDLANVANAAARLGTTLSNGGNGAFVYEQDTGELFYSGNGSFAGGGMLIGIVTAYGSTPWTFNANSFMQV